MRFKSWVGCANYGGIIDTLLCVYPMRYMVRFTSNCYIIVLDGFSNLVWVQKCIYAFPSFDAYILDISIGLRFI